MKKNVSLIFILSFFASISFFLQMNVDPSLSTLDNLSNSLKTSFPQATLLLIPILLFYKASYFKNLTSFIPTLILSIFVSLIWVMAISFNIDDTLNSLYSSTAQVIKSCILLIGFSYFIFLMFAILNYILDFKSKEFSPPPLNSFNKRTILKDFYYHLVPMISEILFIIWSIPLIYAYPAYVDYDSWYCLAEYHGFFHMDVMHPPIFIYLIGIFSDIGIKLFNDFNICFFLYRILQIIIYSLILAYSVSFIMKLKAPIWLILIYLIIISICPFYSKSVTIILKDHLFSIFVLLFIIELCYLLTFTKQFISSWWHYLLLFISIFFTMSLRYNGKYILYPTLFFLFIYLFIHRSQLTKRAFYLIPSVILTSILLSISIEQVIIKARDAYPATPSEALSFPLQQTARVVKNYPNEITQKQRETILRVIDIDSLAEAYEPRLSDRVKSHFRHIDATKKDIIAYLWVWFKMFFQFPLTYISATVNQSYLLIYPFESNDIRLRDYAEGNTFKKYETQFKNLGYYDTDAHKKRRKSLMSFFDLIYKIPILSELSHTYLYVLIFLFILIQAIARKKYIFLLPSIPIILSIVVLIAGPCIKHHPRYTYPVVYSLPIILSYYLYLIKNSRKEKSK